MAADGLAPSPGQRVATSPPVSRDPRQRLGVLLFASTRTEPRSRRPTDIALAVASFTSLIILATWSRIGGGLDERTSEVLASFPGFLDVFWLVLLWTPIAWAVILLVASVVRRRAGLVRDLLAAEVTAVLLAWITAGLVAHDSWRGLSGLTDTDGPPAFPPLVSVIAIAAVSTAAPHLTRPFRHFGRWVALGQLVAVCFLGVSRVSGGLAALAVGLLASALVHLAVGSPGGLPTTGRIAFALSQLGIEADRLELAPLQGRGVVRFDGYDAQGPISVKVYGRDAWDGQLLASLWRGAWYRGSHRTARLSRVELVEHEGFMTLLAERAGVRVPTLLTAGSAGQGDALVVVRPHGVPLAPLPAPVGEAAVEAMWDELEKLHGAGIAMRWLGLDRLVVHTDGTIGFSDLSSSAIILDPADVLRDRAQALAVSAVLLGETRSVASCRSRFGDDALLETLTYLQEAAIPSDVLDALRERDVELDAVRSHASEMVGAPEPPLVKLRRVTIGSLLNLALIVIAAYTLISLIAHLDLETFIHELADASWWWLAFALLLAQLPRLPAAISTMGSIERPLPLGPLTALQFAICFVNLAIPSTAARVAINVRFFQRCGIPPATALSAGAIDSVCGFVVQIGLFLALFFLSDIDLDLSTNLESLSGVSTVALIIVVVIVAMAGVVLLVPSLRRRLFEGIAHARVALRVLRSPKKLAQLVGGNLANQILFGVALSTCVYAFDAEISLGEAVLINTVVSLFAGLLPVPGGIGVSEAGLTIGLVSAGIPAETAAAAALAYRFTTFYLPPLWGFPCYQWLVKRRYL